PFGFAGGYTDPDGLIYLVNRYYAASTGQFLSVDPEVSSTLQPYAYADGDPVSASDPSGLRVPVPGPAPYPISCKHGWYRVDAEGSDAEIIYDCEKGEIQWGFTLSAFNQSIAVGDVTETGMIWFRDGVGPKHAEAHVRTPSYRFHGTFPVPAEVPRIGSR